MSNATKLNKAKRPSHAIFQVIGEKDKARWLRVGAGWKNKDGKGLLLVFDAYPVVGRTVIREISSKDDDPLQTSPNPR
jgi:hypothetical protein